MRSRSEALERALRGVLLSVAVLTIILIAFAGHFRELSDHSALDMAQVARNLAEGRGYTTSVPTAMSLSVVTRAENHPELTRPPAYIATVAGAMRLFGDDDRVVALTSTVFLVLCAGAVYLLGARLFGVAAGIVAMVVFVSIPGTLRTAILGNDGTFLALLVTVLFLLLLAWRTGPERGDAVRAVGLGIVCAVAYLARHEMLVFFVIGLLFVALHRRRQAVRPIAIALIVFAATVTPWLWRTYQFTGTPIASLGSYTLVTRTSFRPDVTLTPNFSTPDTHPIREALSQPVPMAQKFVSAGLEYFAHMPRMVNGYLAAFFIGGLPLAIARRKHALLHSLALLAAVLVSVVLALYGQVNAVVMSLVPVATVVAVGWIILTVDDALGSFAPAPRNGNAREGVNQQWLRPRRAVALIAVTLFLMTPVWPFLFHNTPPYTTPLTTLSERLAERPERVLVSDISLPVAWHADKIVLPLPRTPATLERIREAGVEVEALYLSPNALRIPPSGRIRPWLEWLSSDEWPVTPLPDEEVPGIVFRFES